jgi:acetyl-CoA carboxylase biotin carboxyl carrier protein
MKAKEIRDLIDFISQSGLEEVNIETQEFKIAVRKSSQAVVAAPSNPVVAPQKPVEVSAPAQASQQTAGAPPAPAAQPSAEDSKYIEIKSPMIGTFYRSPSPDADPFIKEGDTVKVGQTVCIIEAMKLFNEIESEIAGRIVKVLVEEASPVEFDQPLYLVDPS